MTQDMKAFRERFPVTALCQYNLILQILQILPNQPQFFLLIPTFILEWNPNSSCIMGRHTPSHVSWWTTSIQSVKWASFLADKWSQSKNSRELGKITLYQMENI